jgi:hypothetical protein
MQRRQGITGDAGDAFQGPLHSRFRPRLTPAHSAAWSDRCQEMQVEVA